MKDNWALLHACEQAAKTGAPVAICFNLVWMPLRCCVRLCTFTFHICIALLPATGV